MTTMLIAWNSTRESGSFMGDILCALKTAYLFVQNEPSVDKVIVSLSPANEMHFILEKFLNDPRGDGSVPPCEIVWDDWNPGDWTSRFNAWDKWRSERHIEGKPFLHYRELHLRIHGALRQNVLCGHERGLGRRCIYQYWYCGQEHCPDELPPSADWFDSSLINHPPHRPTRDVYISPHCKTQGNLVFSFDYWREVVQKLLDAGLTVTIGYDNAAGPFCDHLNSHPLYKRYWGTHKEWQEELCKHKLVACGNTGTGWLAAACGVPMITMEPPNSVMSDHRYRECGLKNIVEVLDTPDSDYCAKRIIEEVNRKIVLTTGCYDVLHAGHVRHLERSRALGSRLIVALNSDSSVKSLKGPTRPINKQDQRKTVLEALRCVDEVRIFDGPNAIAILQEVQPSVLTCGYGYKIGDVVGRDLVESYGGKVVITCQGDASKEPSTTKIIQRVLRSGDVIEICRIGSAYSVNPLEKLKLMADEFLKVVHLEGDVADLGAYKGGTSLILRRLAPTKDLHILDTWKGTPFDDELCHHKKGEWVASQDDCRKLVGSDENIYYWEGVFPYSTDDKLDRKFCFIYVDMDTYQSTKDAIKFFWPRLIIGGKIVFDDYRWVPCSGVEKAVNEAFVNFKECDVRVIESNYTCVVTKL